MDEADRIYEELITPIKRRMIGTVARIVRDPDEAADTFQSVLSTIWQNLEKIRRHPEPHAYILSICISKSYDAVRRQSRKFEREVSTDDGTVQLSDKGQSAQKPAISEIR